uniref:Uncharacterized protein n=1 Tax=Rhizophora mucronata TaxID=61149 RepID=A0A2P2QY39_RHIMU
MNNKVARNEKTAIINHRSVF